MSVRSFMHGKLSVIVHCYPGVKLDIVWKGLQVTSKLAAYTSFSSALLLIKFIKFISSMLNTIFSCSIDRIR